MHHHCTVQSTFDTSNFGVTSSFVLLLKLIGSVVYSAPTSHSPQHKTFSSFYHVSPVWFLLLYRCIVRSIFDYHDGAIKSKKLLRLKTSSCRMDGTAKTPSFFLKVDYEIMGTESDKTPMVFLYIICDKTPVVFLFMNCYKTPGNFNILFATKVFTSCTSRQGILYSFVSLSKKSKRLIKKSFFVTTPFSTKNPQVSIHLLVYIPCFTILYVVYGSCLHKPKLNNFLWNKKKHFDAISIY